MCYSCQTVALHVHIGPTCIRYRYHHHWAAVVFRSWEKASPCRLQVGLSCAVLCQIVSLQYLSRSSLHRLACLPYRLFLSRYTCTYMYRGRALIRAPRCQNIMPCHNLIYQLLNRSIGNITANNNERNCCTKTCTF